MKAGFAGLACGWLLTYGAVSAQTPAAQVDQLADRFVHQMIAYDPTQSYWTGIKTMDHSRFPDRTPQALAALDAVERADLKDLNTISSENLSATAQATFADLKEQLESDLQLRVCNRELWNVNHFHSWQTDFARTAQNQPVASLDERTQALRRWSSVPRYVDVEIANLRRGLAQGYSAPKSVVRRTITQINAMASGPAEKSPFYSPVARSTDVEFKARFGQIIAEQIDPALMRYSAFLENEYLPKAREGVAVSDLPDGIACYQAFLRHYTTLNRTPQEVYDLGRKTVAENEAEVLRMGKEFYSASDLPSILAAIKANPEDHFGSKDELLNFSQGLIGKAKAATATRLIDRMPTQDVVVEPEPAAQDAAGVSSHYNAPPDPTRPATYEIELGNWASETRGEAEITAFHETLPGHHLAIALSGELASTKFAAFFENSAYNEGWARYAEAMAEEAGLYQNKSALILRRIWPAHGMVVDAGLHVFHWTRQQAIDYLVSSGRFTPKSADDAVDRIAVIPGQSTAYDTGGLEIRALRREAEAKLGSRFNLRTFNHAVLEQGSVPLTQLHLHVETWIVQQLSQKTAVAQPDASRIR